MMKDIYIGIINVLALVALFWAFWNDGWLSGLIKILYCILVVWTWLFRKPSVRHYRWR